MKRLLAVLVGLLAGSWCSFGAGPQRFFDPADLTITGVYYYPEHWDEAQWGRDLKQISELGFDFVHYAEFAWAQLEPQEGVYDFGWLDRAVDLADSNGLKVIMCTSTATPPVWLVRKHPDILLQLEDGTRVDHGSRQHPSVSNEYYREYSMVMVDKIAERYGADPRIIGWQLDNEPRPFVDYGDDAQKRFREWLREKYGDIGVLNKAWGTAFWSQVYSDFSQVNIPMLSQQFMNTHQILDYRRFNTDETVTFLDEQTRRIRRHIKGYQWVTTNLIPLYDNGHLRRIDELDFHSYTRYMVFGENYGVGRKGYRLGPVERIAKANDFFRTIDGVYGVMELQPGQVNWGTINPQPLPGAVRLWLWHVFAGGSNFTCTYRYRQPIYGTELYHYGIVGPDGVTPTPGGLEFRQFIDEIAVLREHARPEMAPPAEFEARRAAILFDHENEWEMAQNSQTLLWNTEEHVDKYYDPLKSFGAPVDFIGPTDGLDKYNIVIAPAYEMVDAEVVQKWTTFVEEGGNLVLSVRTGHKTRSGQLFEAPYGYPIYDLIGAGLSFYDLLMPHDPGTVVLDGIGYEWTSWGDVLELALGTEVWAIYEGDFYAGSPAVVHRSKGKGTVTYVGADSHEGMLEKAVLQKLYQRLGIEVLELPAGVNIEYRDGFGIAVNYGDRTHALPIREKDFIIGAPEIPTAGVAVWLQ